MCEAQKVADLYVKHDKETLAKLAKVFDPEINMYENQDYISTVKESRRLIEDAMTSLRAVLREDTDKNSKLDSDKAEPKST